MVEFPGKKELGELLGLENGVFKTVSSLNPKISFIMYLNVYIRINPNKRPSLEAQNPKSENISDRYHVSSESEKSSIVSPKFDIPIRIVEAGREVSKKNRKSRSVAIQN